jgi:hypothetical protein
MDFPAGSVPSRRMYRFSPFRRRERPVPPPIATIRSAPSFRCILFRIPQVKLHAGSAYGRCRGVGRTPASALDPGRPWHERFLQPLGNYSCVELDYPCSSRGDSMTVCRRIDASMRTRSVLVVHSPLWIDYSMKPEPVPSIFANPPSRT